MILKLLLRKSLPILTDFPESHNHKKFLKSTSTHNKGIPKVAGDFMKKSRKYCQPSGFRYHLIWVLAALKTPLCRCSSRFLNSLNRPVLMLRTHVEITSDFQEVSFIGKCFYRSSFKSNSKTYLYLWKKYLKIHKWS